MRGRARMGLAQPATCRIRVQGWVSERWAEWVNGMAMAREGDDNEPITTPGGAVAEQAVPLALLQRLYNLGFAPIEVRHLEMGMGRMRRVCSLA